MYFHFSWSPVFICWSQESIEFCFMYPSAIAIHFKLRAHCVVCLWLHALFCVHRYYCLENVWSLRPYIWDKYAPRMEICSPATDLSKSVCWTVSDLPSPSDLNFAFTLFFQQVKFTEGVVTLLRLVPRDKYFRNVVWPWWMKACKRCLCYWYLVWKNVG